MDPEARWFIELNDVEVLALEMGVSKNHAEVHESSYFTGESEALQDTIGADSWHKQSPTTLPIRVWGSVRHHKSRVGGLGSVRQNAELTL